MHLPYISPTSPHISLHLATSPSEVRGERSASLHRLLGQSLRASMGVGLAARTLTSTLTSTLTLTLTLTLTVHSPCASEAERGDNCAAALEAMKALGFKDAASIIKPSDLAAGKVKSRARGLLWLLMRQVRARASVRVS